MTILLISSAIVFFSAAVQGMLGTGYAIIGLPLLTHFYDPKSLVPLVNLHSLFLGGAILAQSWRQAQIWRVWRLFIGGAIGTPVGVYCLRVIDPTLLKVVIAPRF